MSRIKNKIRIDFKSICAVTGYLLLVEFLMLLIPMAVSLCYGDKAWTCFLPSLGTSLFFGLLLIELGEGRRRRIHLNRREGYLLTAVTWIIFSLVGMIPFMYCAHPLTPVDAFFETMSGFTTTGATVISDVEVLSHGILLWRSLIQWVGGLGIVIFMLAVLPSLNQSGGVPMFNAETTGIVHDKLHPRIRQTAESLWLVYSGLTVLLILFLWAGPMDLFDAVCQSMTTMSTGGFSTRNASIAAWGSDYIALVISIFMLIGGVNFMLLYGVLKGRVRQLFRNDVLRAYLLLIVLSWLAITVAVVVRGEADNIGDALLLPLFQVATTMTTTGFSYGAYESWGGFVYMMLVILMFMGACAGSTTGALKVDRFLALFKNTRKEVELTLYPRHMLAVEINGRQLSDGQMSKISAFFMLYIALAIGGAMLMCAYGYSFSDGLFASASCIGNNGLGYGATGSGGSFGELPDAVKIVFSLLMLVGRLEVFTVIVIFSKKFWRS